MAKLGDICTVVSGSTPSSSVAEYWDGKHIWITPAELSDDSFIIYDSVRHITNKAIQETSLKPFPEGTVILSSRAPIGKTAIAGCKMYCNQGFKNLICSDSIYNKYLYFFLSAKTDYLNSLGRGATFKEISKHIVENIEISLPAIEEQKKRAAILEKLMNLIHIRRKQLSKLDQLVKSRFIEMFGEPIENSMNLPTVHMGKILFLKAGITTPANEIHEQSKEFSVPCYGGNGIRGYVKMATQNGIYPLIGRQGALCGNIQLAVGEFHATEHAILVTPRIKMNIVWLFYLLTYMNLFRFHTGAAQPGLSVKNLNIVEIPVANITFQEQFADFVQQVDKFKSSVKQSLEKLETLKKSLMQEYFG